VTLLELLAATAGTGVVAAWQILASDGLRRLTISGVACSGLLLSGISQFAA
jgi:hypothetical protein